VKGLVTVSSPFGGTTDQAITVRLGAVEWDIHEWVKNPISKIAKDLAAHAQVRRGSEFEVVCLGGWLVGGRVVVISALLRCPTPPVVFVFVGVEVHICWCALLLLLLAAPRC
jgi:hypothetical protein